MIKGIIFDLDGTLLDTVKDLATASNEVMKEYGFPVFSDEEIARKVGNGISKLIERCLPEDQLHLIDEAVKRFSYHYGNCYLNDTAPFKGMMDLLNELQDRNILLGVNTNKGSAFCENLLKEKLVGINFFRIIGSRDNVPNKPDPYSCKEIINDMKLNKDEVLYVGDSDVDVITGKNAGVKTVWVSWGLRSYEDVKDSNPDYMIDEPKQLLNIIDEIG